LFLQGSTFRLFVFILPLPVEYIRQTRRGADATFAVACVYVSHEHEYVHMKGMGCVRCGEDVDVAGTSTHMPHATQLIGLMVGGGDANILCSAYMLDATHLLSGVCGVGGC